MLQVTGYSEYVRISKGEVGKTSFFLHCAGSLLVQFKYYMHAPYTLFACLLHAACC